MTKEHKLEPSNVANDRTEKEYIRVFSIRRDVIEIFDKVKME
jgi:hypothetical protein